eukprot:s311_g10.t1
MGLKICQTTPLEQTHKCQLCYGVNSVHGNPWLFWPRSPRFCSPFKPSSSFLTFFESGPKPRNNFPSFPRTSSINPPRKRKRGIQHEIQRKQYYSSFSNEL